MENPKISIIILNWNGVSDTVECLESVRKIDYPNYDIIVVDNGSMDNSVEQLRLHAHDIQIICNGKNLGYAEGNNVGIRYALNNGADYIFLLNNDTIVDDKILKNFIKALENNPDAGIVGAKIYYYSDPDRLNFTGTVSDIDLFDEGYGEIDDGLKYNTIKEIPYASGCALLAGADVFEKIGMLEPQYFLLFEENDFCSRARKAGFKSLFVPDAKVWHKESASFNGNRSPMYNYFFTRNRLLFAQRNLPATLRSKVWIDTIKDFFYCTFRLKGKSLIKRIYWDISEFFKNDLVVRAKIAGMRDFIGNRFGACPGSVGNIQMRFLSNKKASK